MPTLNFIHSVANTPQTVRLFKKITTLGRDNTNDIPIPHPSVDANHAYLVFDGKHYTLSGVSKKSVVQVNGRKDKTFVLAHKDVITLGEVNLTFDLFDEAWTSDDKRVRTEIESYRKLHQLTEKLMSAATIEELLNLLIDAVIEVTGADNGFLILRRENQELDFTVARNLNRETIGNAINYVSDTIISRVIQTRRPVIVSDALNDEQFKSSASVLNLKLSSVMCVPLIARGSLLGIIYVGNNNVINLFTPDKLQLMEIFAGQASLLIQNALLLNELQVDKQSLKEQIEQMRYGSMVGASESMREVFRKIEKVAGIDVPVLIQGETGTGKELVAREIHLKSSRRNGPFVVINCGAIPRELLESEMFGHLRGSFTGAVANKIGKFKAANGGTLFLDEIGDMPLELQVKILRALEEHKIVPVGDTRLEAVDIRVIAATNIPLERAAKEGAFREDLFYRLNVITIWLPPLRDRRDDVTLIAKYFLARYAKEYERRIKGFSPRSLEAILNHEWPGNVREVENRIKKAVIMADRNLIEPEDLDLSAAELQSIKPLAEAREEFQMEYIREALRRNGGNRTKTAQVLDVDPRTIFRYLEKMTEEEV
ncbi:MAG: GAF domain-containing protein [Myxococcales bacterium]|nr:MAG: GAF domain-containing protein [Myxococcales bacterium]